MNKQNNLLTAIAFAGIALAALIFLAPGAEAAECPSQFTTPTDVQGRLVAQTDGATATATFCSGDAAYSTTVSLSDPHEIYIGRSHATPVGANTDLGSFMDGDGLIFKAVVHGTGDTFYSGIHSRNPDNRPHAAISDLGGGVFHLGFEDQFGGGDNDFTDVNIIIETTGFLLLEPADTDGDGLDDDTEDGMCTDARDVDSDDDGLSDGFEFYNIGTDPCNADTDGDGLDDVTEHHGCTDPVDPDSDGDGRIDGEDGTPCKATIYEGHAQAVLVSTRPVSIGWGDTGVTRSEGPRYNENYAVQGATPIGTVTAARGVVDSRGSTVDRAGAYQIPSNGAGVYAGSEVGDVRLEVPGLGLLEVRGVYADAYASCDGGAGTTRIREILIDGERVFVPANGGIITGHNTIERIGQFEIRLNNEVRGDGAFYATAFRLTSVTSGTDISIGYAHAKVYHCDEGDARPDYRYSRVGRLESVRIEIPGL